LTQASFKITVNVEPDVTEQWNGEGIVGRLVKSEPAKQFTLTVAYPANKPDVGKARDGHRDFAGEDDIEKAAHQYMLNSREVGLWHENGTEGAGRVVESYIYRGPDWTIGDYVVKAGDWLLGVKWGDSAWAQILDNKIQGLSMQGTAKRKIPTPADIARLRSK
jgi:hypothetical protein